MLNHQSTMDSSTPKNVVDRTLANVGYVEELNPSIMHSLIAWLLIDFGGINMKFVIFCANFYMKLFKKMTKHE